MAARENHPPFWRAAWKLTRAYWYSAEKWQARGLLALIIGLNLAHVYLLVLLNAWNNTFYDALQNMDKDGFFSALKYFGLLAAIYIIVAVYQLYLQQMLEINWRRWLTVNYLDAWLKDHVYYRMEIIDNRTDNPDQRISDDLRLFAASTLTLAIGLLQAVVTLVSFIAILWNLSGTVTIPLGSRQVVIPGYLVWTAVGYALVGTWLTVKIGRPLVGLNFFQQRYEADFRFSLVRLRESSESVAFYKGEGQERSGFLDSFRKVYSNFWELMVQRKKLTWFTSGYFQIAIIFPFIVAGPRFFAGQIQLGGLMQISSAFRQVQESLSFIIDSYADLAEWQAVVNRLVGFIDHMEQVALTPAGGEIRAVPTSSGQFRTQGLAVHLPDGSRLLQPVDLIIEAGDSILITGPSGCGKSTLLRSLAGLWPFGSGNVLFPEKQTIMFVPQRSYMPLGSLRDAILYPHVGHSIDDTIVRSVMCRCRLDGFIDQLGRRENWAHILSLGEQQRIAFARILLTRPEWLFLDEATSALDESTEYRLYGTVREYLAGTTVVSVGHRNTLQRFHRKRLDITAGGVITISWL